MQSSNSEFKIIPLTLEVQNMKTNAFAYIPSEPKNKIAAFSHGYTSHKASILNWSTALLEKQVPSIVFDLPGHYLGGIYPLESREEFTEYTHLFYEQALQFLQDQAGLAAKQTQAFVGGHSLGALFALKSLDILEGDYESITAIGVGIGINSTDKHLYSTKLFSRTLEIRNCYVDPFISTDKVFPWIGEQKRNLSMKNKRVHLITGEDDLVVGRGGMQNLIDKLSPENEVSFEEPNRMAHHLPEYAAKLVAKFICS